MITPKKIFNIQKRVMSIILGLSIFLSPCITYKICEYSYYIKHKGECSYNIFGMVTEYETETQSIEGVANFFMFLGWAEYGTIILGIVVIIVILIVALGYWLITDGGKEKKKKNEDE